MDDKELQDQLSQRFKELPEKVRQAITSADVEGHLRQLSEKHKLHLDQWALLENEVMLTMLGFQKTTDLAKNIAREVSIQEDAAEALAADISATVFAPIREELERVAPSPIGAETAAGAVEIREATPPVPVATPQVTSTPIAPATPPKSAPEATVERAPISNTYGSAVPSHERKAVSGDPYREQLS